MKIAKIFAIMFALVLAVFCLNGPFAYGGDEHPWDEEGGGGGDGGDLNGTPPDTDNPESPPTVGTGTVAPDDGSLIILLMKYSLSASLLM